MDGSVPACHAIFRTDTVQHQVTEHGWKFLQYCVYGNKTGFLDLPGLPTLLYRLLLGNLQAEVWVKVIFPLRLLAGVGSDSVLTVFLASHITYQLSIVGTHYAYTREHDCIDEHAHHGI
jgi:hypothetical protein